MIVLNRGLQFFANGIAESQCTHVYAAVVYFIAYFKISLTILKYAIK